jgi:hypothetical protein
MGNWNHQLSFCGGLSGSFYPVFFNEIGCTFFWWIYISPFQVLLMDFSIYQYEVIFFILFFISAVLNGWTLYIYKGSYNVSNISYEVIIFVFLFWSLLCSVWGWLPCFLLSFIVFEYFPHPFTFRLWLSLPVRHISAGRI